MRPIKTLILTITFSILLFLLNSIALANVTSMYIEPNWQQVNIGDIFTVDICLDNSNSTVLDTVLSWVSYDPFKLEVQDSDTIQEGIQILSDPLGLYGFNYHMANSVDSINGKIDFQEGFSAGGTTSASGTFARISFKARELTSVTPLDFNFSIWTYTPTTAVLRGSNDILALPSDHTDGTFGASVTVVPEPMSLVLLGSGLIGLLIMIKKQRYKKERCQALFIRGD